MVIDTSALVAILQNEPERRHFNEAIEEAESCSISSATLVEASIIIESRYGSLGLGDLDLLVSKAEITVVPVDLDQALIARQAFSRYGKGRHPAGLNHGDCFSYVLAKSLGQSLLQKGADFVRTDLIIHPAGQNSESTLDSRSIA